MANSATKHRGFRPISAEIAAAAFLPRHVGKCCLWGTRLTAPLGQTYPWRFGVEVLADMPKGANRASQRMQVK